jgi:hypothetical protein
MPDNKTAEEEWELLCDEWRAKQKAALRFRLFEGRLMVTDRLNEWERLRAAEREVRDRMDAFIASYRAGAGQR